MKKGSVWGWLGALIVIALVYSLLHPDVGKTPEQNSKKGIEVIKEDTFIKTNDLENNKIYVNKLMWDILSEEEREAKLDDISSKLKNKNVKLPVIRIYSYTNGKKLLGVYTTKTEELIYPEAQ